MKKCIIGTLMTLLLFVGCNNDKRKLFVYNWAEYIDPEVIVQFEAENNCRVVLDNFDSNEAMLAKLLAGAVGYDVVFPTSYIIPTMVKNDLLAKIDKNMLTNVVANFDHKYDRFIDDRDFEYAVPYAFGMTGIGWRSDILDLPDDISWNVFADTDIKRICLLDDIREMIGIGLKYNGYSVNSTNRAELAKALETIIEWKRNATKLDNVQYRTALITSEIYMSIGYNSDTLQIQDENPDTPIKFKIPKEGSTCCFDEIVILKDADIELSHKFIDFLYRPDIAAKNCRYICSAQPNEGMKEFMEPEDLENELMFPTEDILNRLEMEKEIDDGLKLWNETWDKFKAAK